MKGRRLLWGSLAIGLASLALVAYALLHPDTHLIAQEEFKGVIFGHRAAAEALGSMLAARDTLYWTPSRDEIRRLEARLRMYVARERPDVGARLATYRRQYFGFTRGAMRRIYVVGFCDEGDLDWRREFVSTAESVGCHFEAEYDVDTDRLSFFWTLDE